MKIHIILPAFILTSSNLFSQQNSGMGREFAELAAHGGVAGKGFATFQNYSSTDIEGSQFFLPDWESGEVVTIRKEVFNREFQFLYDKVRQELFIKEKDSSLVLLTNKDEIQSFTLKDGERQYYFVNSKLFTDSKPQVFYQVLVYDSVKLSLFKYIKTTLVKANLSDMTTQRGGKVYDAFVDKFLYYIVLGGGEPKPVQLKTKSVKNVLTDLGISSGKYLDDHPQPVNEEYLMEMIKQFNHYDK